MPNAKEYVLVIDDDEVDREQIQRLIGETHELAEAATGRAGLHLVQQRRPGCVLLDFRLPDESGLDLLPALVKQHVPVVMLTGQGSQSVAVQAMKQGAYDYLTKEELTADSLRSAIGNVLQRAELEQQLRLKQEELEQFVSVASHDMKSPLRTMSMLCESVLRRKRDEMDADVVEVFDAVVRDAQRMTDMVEALLEYSRVGRNDQPPKPVDLNKVMLLVQESLKAAIDESAATIESNNLPTVVGHRVSLVQLLQNLVANAIKFRGEEPPVVKVDALITDDQLHVSVNDNGIGIAAQHHESIFTPFKRLHGASDYEGSGIGLATCKRIVDQLDGRIWVQSEPGEGTIFRLTLPLRDVEMEALRR